MLAASDEDDNDTQKEKRTERLKRIRQFFRNKKIELFSETGNGLLKRMKTKTQRNWPLRHTYEQN